MPVAGARQDRAADVAILPQVDPGRGNRVRCGLVEDVRLLGIVERDVGDPVTLFVIDGQAALPFSLLRAFPGVELHLRRAHGRRRDRYQRIRGGGFQPRSASASILEGVREGRFRLIWNQPTRRETEMILQRIPRLDWRKLADLFRREGEFTGTVDPAAFTVIADADDRKFAALSAAAHAPLVTSDALVLAQRGR